MKIKNLFPFLVLFAIIVCISCDTTEKTNQKNKGLIAQADIEPEVIKKPVAELVAEDKGFSILKRIIDSTGFSESFKDKEITIFAPINLAFNKLPKGSIEELLKPENKEQLTKILNCHIIPSVINKEDIVKAIKENGGSVKLKTLGGTRLIASRKRGSIFLIDKNGNGGKLITTDVEASNGYVHTIETVMMPKK